jgi:Fe-S cluster assembly protein SufD
MSLERVHRSAQTRVESRGMPKPGDEQWRFTPVAVLLDRKGRPAAERPLAASEVDVLPLASLDAYRLVFSNGRWLPSFSTGIPAGLKIGSVKQGAEEALLLGTEETGFGALAAAKFEDGPYVRVSKGTKLDKPVHILYVGTADADEDVHYRGAIVLEAGASAVVVEEYVGQGKGALMTNTVMRAEIAENASLEAYALLREPDTFLGVRDFRVRIAANGRLRCHAVAMGGELCRCDANVKLDGEGAEAELNGLYVAGGRQHFDFHTSVEHVLPHGTSRELYKGVLDGRARAVFNGLIEVQPGAQKTDANVYNKNLLLSEEGLVNTKPEFKIHANDVQCKHGATIGQLNADALFYLRSRGIGVAEARRVLVYAFASEMLGRMSLEPVREALSARLQAAAGMERP